jgi:hypothetical protein
VGAVCNFVVAIIVSRLTKETPQEVQDLVEHVRMPSGAGDAQSH